MLQNIGTHLDSPSHFIEDGLRASQLNINDLVNLPLCIIDIRGKPNVVDYELSLDDVKAYEQRHGRIPKRSLVVANSGW
jgi:kynurenine formamidase